MAVARGPCDFVDFGAHAFHVFGKPTARAGDDIALVFLFLDTAAAGGGATFRRGDALAFSDDGARCFFYFGFPHQRSAATTLFLVSNVLG